MTFVVGLNCCDGIVLCTDSLEDDGITKKPVDKIRMMGNTQWGVAIAGAGAGPTIDKFCDEVRTRLPADPFNLHKIVNKIEQQLDRFKSKYVKTNADNFEVVVGIYNRPHEHWLYYSAGNVLSRSINDCHTGMGNELWRLVADTLYHRRNSVADNVRLAVFATRLACKYSSGVADPIQVVSHTSSDLLWRGYSQADILAVEKDLKPTGFKEAVQKYWRLHNPPTNIEQLAKFNVIKTPGSELTLLDGVKLEELYTVAGRQRASKTFRRNTDKLQQRALVVRQRYQQAQSGASQTSAGKTRT